MNNKDSINLWDEAAEEYDRFIKAEDPLRARLLDKAVLGLLGNIKDKKVLDAGCGQGYFSAILEKRGGRIEAVDGSDRLTELAKENYKDKGIDFLHHDLKQTLPFNDSRFDVVLANMTLMDFDPIKFTVKEFFRVLKESGVFVFSIPHPSFRGAELKKGIKDKISNQPPFYKIKEYINERGIEVKIGGKLSPTIYYHRPLEFYFETLGEAGFFVDELKEPVLKNVEEREKGKFLELCTKVPPILVIRAKKIINDR